MRRSAPLALSFLLFACSHTTQLTDVFRDPSATATRFNKVAAFVMAEDPSVRQTAEDEIVRRIGPKAVASYTLFSKADEQSADTVRAKLQSLGIDGAVTMSLLSMGEEPIDPRGEMGDSGKSFSGYYGHHSRGSEAGWENVARIQTQIFSVPDNKLLWSAATKTFNPKDAKELVAKTADQVEQELRKSGLR
jgi:hypothetical protein